MLRREGHVCQHVVFGAVHKGSELGDRGAELVGDRAPLGLGRLGGLLCKGGGDERRYHPAPALSGMRQDIAHEVNRLEEHTSELQSLMRISYAVFCLKKKTKKDNN